MKLKTNASGLPTYEETYVYNNELCTRNYIATDRLHSDNVCTMHLTTYENKDVKKHDFVTKVVFASHEQKGLGQKLYFNYYPSGKGVKLAHQAALRHASARGHSESDINKWYSDAELKLRAIVKANRVQGTRSNTTKNPKFYTAPLRYSIGSKAFATNGLALIICNEDGSIKQETILVGAIDYTHTPVKESHYTKRDKNNKPLFKKKLENGYSYTKAVLWMSDLAGDGDDWDDEPITCSQTSVVDIIKPDSSEAMNDDYLEELLGGVL